MLTEFRAGRRFDQEQPHGAPPEREAVVVRLAPDAQAPASAWAMHEAMRRALALPQKDWLDRQLAVVLDGMEARHTRHDRSPAT